MNELEAIRARAASRQLSHNRNHRGTGDLLRETEADLDRAIAIAEGNSTTIKGFSTIVREVEQERDEARADAERIRLLESQKHDALEKAQAERDHWIEAAKASEITRKEAIAAGHLWKEEAEKARAAALALRDAYLGDYYRAAKMDEAMADTEWLEQHR